MMRMLTVGLSTLALSIAVFATAQAAATGSIATQICADLGSTGDAIQASDAQAVYQVAAEQRERHHRQTEAEADGQGMLPNPLAEFKQLLDNLHQSGDLSDSGQQQIDGFVDQLVEHIHARMEESGRHAGEWEPGGRRGHGPEGMQGGPGRERMRGPAEGQPAGPPPPPPGLDGWRQWQDGPAVDGWDGWKGGAERRAQRWQGGHGPDAGADDQSAMRGGPSGRHGSKGRGRRGGHAGPDGPDQQWGLGMGWGAGGPRPMGPGMEPRGGMPGGHNMDHGNGMGMLLQQEIELFQQQNALLQQQIDMLQRMHGGMELGSRMHDAERAGRHGSKRGHQGRAAKARKHGGKAHGGKIRKSHRQPAVQ